ncbi:MAG: type III pantothenate kinase [Clostridia bacterium]|nr:type III pantothenate kinase [Clostridia bacterium]MCL6521127.1 type III pantothenate kinase [Bacillota bacterium]
MLLALDVGNTTTMLGLYRGRQLVRHWRVSTRPERTSDEWAVVLQVLFDRSGERPEEVDGAAVACVVPPALAALERFLRQELHVEPLVVGPGVHTGMPIRYENPREVGADRIVDAVAAYEKYGGPVIVVDFGTATTFDVVDAGGSYLGGVIAPGIGISTEALFEHASKLPRVELVRPPRVIGRNTVHSMQSGILFGFAGQVDALVRRIQRELGQETAVVATGGYAELVASESECIQRVDPFLTLAGLEIVYRRNQARAPALEPE